MKQTFTVYRFTNTSLDTNMFRELYRERSCAFGAKPTTAIKANLTAINNGILIPAATLTCTVGDLFELTNTIHSNWFEADGVNLLNVDKEPRLSSSTMGDVFKDEAGNLFMYAMTSIVPLVE